MVRRGPSTASSGNCHCLGNLPMINKTPEERKAIAKKSRETRQKNKLAALQQKTEQLQLRDSLLQEIIALENELYEMKKHKALSMISHKTTKEYLLSKNQLLENEIPWNTLVGIYFLIKDKEIVYIGQSTNVYRRLTAHTDKHFSGYVVIPCETHELDILESLYIHCLQPKYNGNCVNNAKLAPITLKKLLAI